MFSEHASLYSTSKVTLDSACPHLSIFPPAVKVYHISSICVLTTTGWRKPMKVQKRPLSSTRARRTACFSVSSISRHMSVTSCMALSSCGCRSPRPGWEKAQQWVRDVYQTREQRLTQEGRGFHQRVKMKKERKMEVWKSVNVTKCGYLS